MNSENMKSKKVYEKPIAIIDSKTVLQPDEAYSAAAVPVAVLPVIYGVAVVGAAAVQKYCW